MSADDPEFLEFFAAEFWPLRRVGFLLTGDWDQAEELAQDAPARTWAVWPRVGDCDRPAAFARKVLLNRHRSLLRRAMVEARHVQRANGSRPQVAPAARRLSVPVSGGAPALVAAVRELDQAGIPIEDVALRRPTLDDVFLRLTGSTTAASSEERAASRPRSSFPPSPRPAPAGCGGYSATAGPSPAASSATSAATPASWSAPRSSRPSWCCSSATSSAARSPSPEAAATASTSCPACSR